MPGWSPLPRSPCLSHSWFLANPAAVSVTENRASALNRNCVPSSSAQALTTALDASWAIFLLGEAKPFFRPPLPWSRANSP